MAYRSSFAPAAAQNAFASLVESLSSEDEDGPGVLVDAHLVVKDEVRAAHGRRVVRDQRPHLRADVVHVEVALKCRRMQSTFVKSKVKS